MKQMPLALEGSWLRIFQNTKNFERKFHTIKLENFGEWNNSAFKVLKKNGANARCLELSTCFFSTQPSQSKHLKKILHSLRQVEELKLNCCEYMLEIATSSKNLKSGSLPNLQSAVINEGDICVSSVADVVNLIWI